MAIDDAAFGELLGQHRRLVFATAMTILSNRDKAEDVTQDVMVKKWMARQRYDTDRSFAAWMVANTRHKCSDVIGRYDNQHPPAPLDDHADVLATHTPGPERVPTCLAVRECLGALPDDQRLALLLKKLWDFTLDETVRLMGRTPSEVRTLLKHAETTMRKCLKEKGIEPSD